MTNTRGTRGPSRRALLGAAASVPALWLSRGVAGAAPARASAGRRAWPGERFQLGVIGCGIRAKNLLRGHFLKSDRFKVVAVCETLPERLAGYKALVDAAYGGDVCAATTDYHEVLGRDDIDGVLIATPDHWHALQAIEACRAKKHVYCEKPLTRTLDEARRVASEAQRAGIVFQTGSQQRTEYGHRFIDAVERVRAGRIGRVLTAHVGVGDPNVPCDLPAESCSLEEARAFDRWLGPAPARVFSETLMPRGMHSHYPAWRRYNEYAGGGLADMGAHHFDIVQWALGMDGSGPVRVEPPQDRAARRGASLVYADGARVVHGGPSGVTFIGTEGVLHVDRDRGAATPEGLLKDPLPDDVPRLPRPQNHAIDWLDAIERGGGNACPAEVGARTAAVCHLLNLAYRHGRALAWDPAAWSFVGDDEANGWRSEAARDGYELPAE
ncbi:MAG: Gfo/Idh/MocA family oxidoreductase [Planctomycetota bacterium]